MTSQELQTLQIVTLSFFTIGVLAMLYAIAKAENYAAAMKSKQIAAERERLQNAKILAQFGIK